MARSKNLKTVLQQQASVTIIQEQTAYIRQHKNNLPQSSDKSAAETTAGTLMMHILQCKWHSSDKK